MFQFISRFLLSNRGLYSIAKGFYADRLLIVYEESWACSANTCFELARPEDLFNIAKSCFMQQVGTAAYHLTPSAARGRGSHSLPPRRRRNR